MTIAQKIKALAKDFGCTQKRVAGVLVKAANLHPEDVQAQLEYVILALVEDPREIQQRLDAIRGNR